jgi:hypothetical protein
MASPPCIADPVFLLALQLPLPTVPVAEPPGRSIILVITTNRDHANLTLLELSHCLETVFLLGLRLPRLL